MLAAPVRVPEIDGTFPEAGTLVPEEEPGEALTDVRAVMAELGIGAEDLTRETCCGRTALGLSGAALSWPWRHSAWHGPGSEESTEVRRVELSEVDGLSTRHTQRLRPQHALEGRPAPCLG